MNNMLIGIAGVLTIHIVDIISLKRIPLLKPIIWIIGISMEALLLAGNYSRQSFLSADI